jgi:hypothetical protein
MEPAGSGKEEPENRQVHTAGAGMNEQAGNGEIPGGSGMNGHPKNGELPDGSGNIGHTIIQEKEPDRHPHRAVPGGMPAAKKVGTAQAAPPNETRKKSDTDKKPVFGVERKTELRGMSAQPSHEDPAQIRRRTERDLKDADAGIPYAKTEKAVRDLVCSLIERQDRMNINIFLEINCMQEDIGMLKDQVYNLKIRKTGPAAGAKK